MGVTLNPFTVAGVDFVDVESIGLHDRFPVLKLLVEGQALVPEPMQCVEEEAQGQFTSVMLAAMKDKALVGAVSISQVNLVRQVGDLLEVSAMVSPYFPGVADELDLVNRFFHHLFHQQHDLANGQQLAILDTMAYKRLKIFDPQDPLHIRIQGVIGKIDEAGDQVAVAADPDDESREIVTVRKAS